MFPPSCIPSLSSPSGVPTEHLYRPIFLSLVRLALRQAYLPDAFPQNLLSRLAQSLSNGRGFIKTDDRLEGKRQRNGEDESIPHHR
jgi:hypothetical protein